MPLLLEATLHNLVGDARVSVGKARRASFEFLQCQEAGSHRRRLARARAVRQRFIISRHLAWIIGRRVFVWSSPTYFATDREWLSMYELGLHFSMCYGD